MRTSTHERPVYKNNWQFIVYDDPAKIAHLFDRQWKTAWAYHDQDTKEDGTVKEPHWHLLVHADFRVSQTAILALKLHKLEGNKFWENIEDKKRAFEYLWHKNNPEKYPYSKDIVVTDSWAFWTGKRKEEEEEPKINIGAKMFWDIVQNKSIDYMIDTYGMNFIKNYRSLYDLAQQYEMQTLRAGELPLDFDIERTFGQEPIPE